MYGNDASSSVSDDRCVCELGACESCGGTVLIRAVDGSLERSGPREACGCGSTEFRRASVDESLG